MEPRPPTTSSSGLLRPPPHHRPSSTSTQSSHSQSSTPRPPPAQISAHPTATISDSANFCGPHSVSIGKGTIIHPRTRLCATEGPIRIGEGCIISEKSVIGTPPNVTPGSAMEAVAERAEECSITISSNVTIGAQVTIHPGAHLHSGVVVDSQVIVGRGADIGSHSKVCARTELLDKARVKEWTVVWGGGKGVGIRTRAKVQKKVVSPFVPDGKGVLEGRAIEDARLLAVKREREVLSRLIVGVKRK
ncbi:transferase hexapeptide domain protein [Aspergillus stella-maris]|uniref:transferase hexapeptide domain protein n=1 Tax=Aspergillus stella-maris TaxID=1810926 RepID=UPI003CCE3612